LRVNVWLTNSTFSTTPHDSIRTDYRACGGAKARLGDDLAGEKGVGLPSSKEMAKFSQPWAAGLLPPQMTKASFEGRAGLL
jgi:hypothetical protein